MGVLKSCYATSGESIEVAVFELYDETAALTAPGFDDVLGEPFLIDTNSDGIGERTRPGTVVKVKAKAKWTTHENRIRTKPVTRPGPYWN